MGIDQRLSRLRETFNEKGIDGLLISQPENRYYLSGFYGSSGYLLISGQSAVLATDFRYTEQAERQAPAYRVFRITGGAEEWLPGLTAELGVSRLGFEAAHMTFAAYRQISGILKESPKLVQLMPLEGVVESLREKKEPEELELINRAISISDSAADHIADTMRPGITEKEAAWEIERFMRENGSEVLPFDIIVASGPNAALPHAHPSERRINEGEPVVIDIGARVGGYCSDLTRTICLGTADHTFQKVYDTVLGAQLTAISLLKEDMTGEEADNLARVFISEAGYGDAFGHSLGHGVGLATHEGPRLGMRSKDVLTDGMVFTIEPGIYLSGWGGVRIEDMAVMRSGRAEVLSRARKYGKSG